MYCVYKMLENHVVMEQKHHQRRVCYPRPGNADSSMPSLVLPLLVRTLAIQPAEVAVPAKSNNINH